MKILFFVSLFKTTSGSVFGGAEKTIVNLANWLAENTSNDIYLVSVHGIEKPFDISPSIHYKGHEVNVKGKLSFNYQIFKNIRSSIKKISPDIIITFEIYPLLYSLLNSLTNKNIRFYYSERNDPKIHYSLLQRTTRNFSLFFTDGIICQTQDALNYFPKKIRNKSVVIHNPVYIPYGKYPLSSRCDNRIVAVGRLVKQKNYLLMIEAFELISKSYPDLILEIYGEGEERKTLQTKIISKNLENKVFLRGSHKDVFDKIYGARMFVMTSKYEGMPNALMEAMGLGIPVVCSDCPCGGPKELIRTGKNGFLFKNNNLQDLIEKMRICLSQNKLELRKNGKMICISHSVNKIFKEWYNFIISK